MFAEEACAGLLIVGFLSVVARSDGGLTISQVRCDPTSLCPGSALCAAQ